MKIKNIWNHHPATGYEFVYVDAAAAVGVDDLKADSATAMDRSFWHL